MKKIVVFFSLLSLVLFNTCKKEKINIFTVEDDIELGQQVKAEIEGNPSEYPILDESAYPDAYSHIRRIRDNILNTDLVDYKDKFNWEVYIIDNDEVLNAFACPGGYMYFYTGLIDYLDNEAEFAGVMGHEMAHVAKRHSTQTLTKVYGISMLFNIALGKESGKAAEIAAQLATGAATLAFSRDHEYEADEYAVKYLYATEYHPPALASFFEKLENAGGTRPPEFLSTHPSPENRLEEIDNVWKNLGGENGELFETQYQEFINSLP